MRLNLKEQIDPEVYDRLHAILDFLSYARYEERRDNSVSWSYLEDQYTWFEENHPELIPAVDRACANSLLEST